MNTLDFGKQVRDALTAGSTVSANKLEQNIGGIVQMLFADEPLEKLTGEDMLRTVINLLDREHRYFQNVTEKVERSEDYISTAQAGTGRRGNPHGQHDKEGKRMTEPPDLTPFIAWLLSGDWDAPRREQTPYLDRVRQATRWEQDMKRRYIRGNNDGFAARIRAASSAFV